MDCEIENNEKSWNWSEQKGKGAIICQKQLEKHH
jgi:hypothetical protein